MTIDPAIQVRPARPEDATRIHEMVVALARYEKMDHLCKSSPESLSEALFADQPALNAIVAEVDGVVCGMATYFQSYSTFFAKRGVYVEDIYVDEEARHRGVGRALVKELCHVAQETGAGRLEWTTLLWNTDALEFFDSIGAQPSDVWTTYRMSGDAVDSIARAKELTILRRAARAAWLKNKGRDTESFGSKEYVR